MGPATYAVISRLNATREAIDPAQTPWASRIRGAACASVLRSRSGGLDSAPRSRHLTFTN